VQETLPRDTIRLGLMPPQTGLVDMYGPEIVWAARIACAEINEQGGVLGRPLELIIEDDGSLPQTAVPAACRLIEEHSCSAIIGNLLSNSRIAVADKVAEPQHIPYLNFSFYEGSIASRYFFHFAALPNQQIDKMIPYMARRYGVKMFFAGNNYEWPRGSIHAGKQALWKLNGECVGEEYLPIGTSEEEIDTLLERVARSGADVFVPYFAGHDQVMLLTRFAEMGLKKHMAVVMGHFDEVMANHLAAEVREGFYSSNTYFMSVDTDQNRAYLKRLASLPDVDGLTPGGNGVLTNFGEGTYLCVKAFAEAVKAAGTTDAEALVDALEHVSISGPQGEVLMDPTTHHAHVNSFLAQCQSDGTFRIVETFGCIAPSIPSRYREQFSALQLHESPSSPGTAARLASEAAEAYNRVGNAQQILSIADMAIIATDGKGVITEVNRSAAELFGYSEEEMPGLSVSMLMPPHFRQRHAELLRQFVEGDENQRRMGQRGEVTGYRKDGTFFPLEASIAKFRNGPEWVLVVTMRDLTELKRAEEELTRRATHDTLTGLPNRALIHERLTGALQRNRRGSTSVALLFVDLDGFKAINDTYGHNAGDHLLKEASRRMIESVRPGDTVARLAGDEFVILCEYVENPSDISSLASRITERVAEPVIFNNTSMFVSASIGIAVGHGTTHSADDMFRSADTAMYAVKEKGRNGWEFFNPSLQQEAERRLVIANGLRSAVENLELELRFQPIVNAETGQIHAAELLLRWFPPHGEVSPAIFIPVAEMNGAIIPIGRWVFEQACLAERRWYEQFGNKAPSITVNLSARQLSDERLEGEFTAILQRTGADPSRIVLEITETSLMADITTNKAMFESLTALGMKAAVDDFGTGYSSLAQLLRLKMDTLKIDREFIDGLDKNDDSRIVVAAICRMGKSLNLRLVAEGVETEVQRDIVRSLGCDSIQGYLYYRPLDEGEFVAAVQRGFDASSPSRGKIHYLIYISRMSGGVDDVQLNMLMNNSRSFNISHGITGFLLSFDDVFMQYIEGDAEQIRNLFGTISKDRRHKDVKILAEGELEKRLFNNWGMGYRRLESSLLSDRSSQRISSGKTYEWLSDNPLFCSNLFELMGEAQK